MPAKNLLQTVVDLASKFIEQKKGVWNHAEWESLLDKVTKAGVSVTDEVERNLGILLESAKFFYHAQALAPTASKTTKPKAKTKAKAK